MKDSKADRSAGVQAFAENVSWRMMDSRTNAGSPVGDIYVLCVCVFVFEQVMSLMMMMINGVGGSG